MSARLPPSPSLRIDRVVVRISGAQAGDAQSIAAAVVDGLREGPPAPALAAANGQAPSHVGARVAATPGGTQAGLAREAVSAVWRGALGKGR